MRITRRQRRLVMAERTSPETDTNWLSSYMWTRRYNLQIYCDHHVDQMVQMDTCVAAA